MPALTWLPDVLRDAGLTVYEVGGWRTRGRPDGDDGVDLDMRPVGLICHATAGSRQSTPASDISVLLRGSATAPPPISQLYLARTGELWMIAAGVCNHAGSGGLWGVQGNSRVIGIEAANDNKGEPWPAAQLDTYHRAAAAICRHMGWPATQAAAHREWNPFGKTDPVGISMPAFRTRVAELLQGDDMPLSDADVDRIAKAVLAARFKEVPDAEWMHLDTAVTQIYRDQKALHAKVDALALGEGLDPEGLRRIVDDAIRDDHLRAAGDGG